MSETKKELKKKEKLYKELARLASEFNITILTAHQERPERFGPPLDFAHGIVIVDYPSILPYNRRQPK